MSETSAGNAAVSGGQNLSERVFVGAQQEDGVGESSFIVEMEVSDSIVIDARVTAGKSSNIGVNWRRDS